MSTPTKIPSSQPPNLFLRLWSWFRGLFFRSQRNTAKLLDAVAEEETVPHSPPAVVSRRVVMGENPLLAPARPRLKPSMVATTKFPVSATEEPGETTKSPIPTELISLPLPVSVDSPKRMTRLSLPLPVKQPTQWTPEETQQFHSPHLVNRETGSKIVPPSVRNRSHMVVPIRPVVSMFPEDLAPKTLVQPRIQDDPELMELVEEFNAKHGDSGR